MFFTKNNKTKTPPSSVGWIPLTEGHQLQSLIDASEEVSVILFKHSTRCNISSSALNRIERKWDAEEMKEVKPYYLDIIAYRDISQQIEKQFGVQHESPQLLVIKNGKCVFALSHMGITYDALTSFIFA